MALRLRDVAARCGAGAALLLLSCGTATRAPTATATATAATTDTAIPPAATSRPNIALQAATPAFATVAAVQPLAESHMQNLRADLAQGDYAGVARDSQAISADLQQIADAQAMLDEATSRQRTAVPDSATPASLLSPSFVQESQTLAAAAAATVAAHKAEAAVRGSALPTPFVSPRASPTPTPAESARATPESPPPTRAATASANILAPAPSPPPARQVETATAVGHSAGVVPGPTGTPIPAPGLPVVIGPMPQSVKPGQTLVVHAGSFAQASCRLVAGLPNRVALPVPNAEKQADPSGAITWWWPVPETASGALVTLTVECQKGGVAGQRHVTVQVR